MKPNNLFVAFEVVQASSEGLEVVMLAVCEAQVNQRQEREFGDLGARAVALQEIIKEALTQAAESATALRPEKALAPRPRNRSIRPKGMEAVRLVMQEGGVLTADEILADLKQRDWDPKDSKDPIGSIQAAILRLRKKAEVEQVGRGKYRYLGAPARRGEAQASFTP
jgi:hypothetical protein